VTNIIATQNGKSVEKQGGLDVRKKLNLTIYFTNNYKRSEIKEHLFDFYPEQYTDDEGKGCQWYQLDFSGMTENVDGCKRDPEAIIPDDCHYRKKPTRVVSIIDFPGWSKKVEEGGLGSLSDYLNSGDYYGFEIVDKDGQRKLNCFRIQAKIK